MKKQNHSEKIYIDSETELFCHFIKYNDEESFNELYDRINLWLPGAIQNIVHDINNTKDIIQQTWVKVLDSKNGFNPKRGSIKNLIYTIARNDALKSVKKIKINIKREIRLDEEINKEELVDSANPVGDIINKDKYQILHEAISKLPFKYREVILLNYFLNFEYQEVVEILNEPMHNIKNRIYKGKQLIRDYLTKKGFEYE